MDHNFKFGEFIERIIKKILSSFVSCSTIYLYYVFGTKIGVKLNQFA